MMALTFTPSKSPQSRLGADAAAARFGHAPPVDQPLFVLPDRIESAIWDHGRSSREEVAGILAGHVWSDGEPRAVVSIEAAIRAERHVETTAVHVSFKPQAWESIAAELDQLGSDMVVVGWYHTHPNLGAFFSSTDLATQARAFRHPWQIGFVLDPVRGERVAYRGPESHIVLPEAIVRPAATAAPSRPYSVESQTSSRMRPLAVALTASILLALLLALRKRRASSPLAGDRARGRG
jgi:proteasome lid subunit RPN8/RPN11